MQPDLPTRPWEKLGSDIFHFNDANYLISLDYYSRFPNIRPLSDTSAPTISSHLTSLFVEYCLPYALTADFGSQLVSEIFKKKFKESGITLTFSSPYHHQANGVAERCVGTTNSLWKKAAENNQCPEAAMWMYRMTPLDDRLPSSYMSSFMGRSPDHHYRVVTSPSNQGTLPTTLIKKPTSRSKPSKQNFTIRETAATIVFLTALNQCT